MKPFLTYTVLVVVVLATVVGIARFYSPKEHFLLVSSVCYGYLIGWSSAWFVQYLFSRRHPRP